MSSAKHVLPLHNSRRLRRPSASSNPYRIKSAIRRFRPYEAFYCSRDQRTAIGARPAVKGASESRSLTVSGAGLRQGPGSNGRKPFAGDASHRRCVPGGRQSVLRTCRRQGRGDRSNRTEGTITLPRHMLPSQSPPSYALGRRVCHERTIGAAPAIGDPEGYRAGG